MDGQRKMTRHELIGLLVEVVDAENLGLIGTKGKIVDETQNTITVKGKTTKKLIKKQIKMKIKLGNKTIEIDGKEIVGRPEERIKK